MSGMKAGSLEEIWALFMMDGRFWMQHPRKEAKVNTVVKLKSCRYCYS